MEGQVLKSLVLIKAKLKPDVKEVTVYQVWEEVVVVNEKRFYIQT
jgi:hypothetical protein